MYDLLGELESQWRISGEFKNETDQSGASSIKPTT